MSNAGYGNHDAPKPGSAEASDPKAASAKPSAVSTNASSPAPPADDRRDVATPGDGACVSSGQAGSDVDAGTG